MVGNAVPLFPSKEVEKDKILKHVKEYLVSFFDRILICNKYYARVTGPHFQRTLVQNNKLKNQSKKFSLESNFDHRWVDNLA